MTALYYLFIYISEALILHLYCSNVFTSKHRPLFQFGLIALTYGILYAISFLQNPYLNILAFISFNFFYITIIYSQKLSTILVHIFTISITMAASEEIILSIFTNLARALYNSSFNASSLFLASILSKLLYFLILYIISHYVSSAENTSTVTIKETLLLCLVPCLSIWILMTFFTLTIYYTDLSQPVSMMLMVSTFFLLLLNLIIFGVYEYMKKKNQVFTELQLQIQKEADSSAYYKMLLEQDENQKILIHDIKKHLQAISVLNEQHNFEKISLYLNHVMGSSELKSSIRICNNDFLNAILCRYLKISQKNHITAHFDIRNHSIDFMNENDINILFSNLLDNACESAAASCDSFIELSVTPRENTNFTIIALENSCLANPFSPETGKLHTRKKDSRRHGFGMKSIQKIVEKYSGTMQTYFDKEHHTFHSIIVLNTKQTS